MRQKNLNYANISFVQWKQKELQEVKLLRRQSVRGAARRPVKRESCEQEVTGAENETKDRPGARSGRASARYLP